MAALLIAAYVLLSRGNQEEGAPPSATRPPTASTATIAPPTTWYSLYFTDPIFPDDASLHTGTPLDQGLAALIDSATRSVEMAIYQLDLPDVTQALLDATARGVTVRLVTDIESLEDPAENDSFLQLDAAGVNIVGGNRGAIMHNKFVVVDSRWVWTGSWNFTENDSYRYNNHAILIDSPALAQNYSATFRKMWLDQAFARQREAGGTRTPLTIQGVTVENYFSPEDNVAEKIVRRIQAAQTSIDFLAFSFTDDDIGAAVLARAAAGVRVRGVFENTGSNTPYSEFGPMSEAGLDVFQDGNPYLMHHKAFVIDGATVILGSFNFTQNAQQSNDENVLIIDDPEIAARFTQEFERVLFQARNPPN